MAKSLRCAGAGEPRLGRADERPGDDAPIDRGRPVGARCRRARRDARARTLPRGRRSAARCLPTCSRWASACRDVLRAELVDDRRAGRVLVAQDAGSPASRDERLREVGSGRPAACRESSPRRKAPACRRSPSGRRACPCPSTSRSPQPHWPATRGSRVMPAGKAPLASSAACPSPRAARWGIRSGPCLQPRLVGAAFRAGNRDVPQRVGARVAEFGRVRRATDADGIEHDEKDAGHMQSRQSIGT